MCLKTFPETKMGFLPSVYSNAFYNSDLIVANCCSAYDNFYYLLQSMCLEQSTIFYASSGSS